MNSNMQQPTYQKLPGNLFATVSFVCGICSLISICAILPSICLGALSILFAVLGKRKANPMNTKSIVGVVISTFSLGIAVFMTVTTIIFLPAMLKDETTRQELNATSELMYGITFDELMEQSGIDLDKYLNQD